LYDEDWLGGIGGPPLRWGGEDLAGPRGAVGSPPPPLRPAPGEALWPPPAPPGEQSAPLVPGIVTGNNTAGRAGAGHQVARLQAHYGKNVARGAVGATQHDNPTVAAPGDAQGRRIVIMAGARCLVLTTAGAGLG